MELNCIYLQNMFRKLCNLFKNECYSIVNGIVFCRAAYCSSYVLIFSFLHTVMADSTFTKDYWSYDSSMRAIWLRYRLQVSMSYMRSHFGTFCSCITPSYFLVQMPQCAMSEIHNCPSSGRGEGSWGRKQIQFPKRCVLCFLEYRRMEKVQKPSNSVCYTRSSEPFRCCFVPSIIRTTGWKLWVIPDLQILRFK
jgi:hypothetical protein